MGPLCQKSDSTNFLAISDHLLVKGASKEEEGGGEEEEEGGGGGGEEGKDGGTNKQTNEQGKIKGYAASNGPCKVKMSNNEFFIVS